ncbi:MAG: ribonuclease H family protein [Dysgonamonadaceae bacterium]|jgi:ribonuclease HI|nr:ribonuclease H family protein [Dysgonamonadaceae bacterium]
MPKKKYYVVWKGVKPGVYDSWIDCKRQIDGFEGALYKSFDTKAAAAAAYPDGPWKYIGKSKENKKNTVPLTGNFIRNSLAVDAACSGNPGKMEYRGVYVETGLEIFHQGPYEKGTNNVGEFLALVHGLALLKKQDMNIPVYSDSMNAILWVKNKQCKTKLEPCEANAPVFDLIARAEKWLQENTYKTVILKWETEKWGEIPADFGRK